MNLSRWETEGFNSERVAEGRLFGDQIEEDPWVIYHGTSAASSGAIEKDGFRYTHAMPSASDIDRINSVFELMRWGGNDLGGYLVLKAFSIIDFYAEKKSFMFFTETSARALLYACQDHAGGEKQRGIRKAIVDLNSYLQDIEVRNAHAADLAATCQDLVAGNAAPADIELNQPPNIDLNWLYDQIHLLTDLDRVATAHLENFSGGVVYALRPDISDYDGLIYNAAMGIKASKPIQANRIVAKIDVPLGFEYRFSMRRNLRLVLQKKKLGLIDAISSRALAQRD